MLPHVHQLVLMKRNEATGKNDIKGRGVSRSELVSSSEQIGNKERQETCQLRGMKPQLQVVSPVAEALRAPGPLMPEQTHGSCSKYLGVSKPPRGHATRHADPFEQ